MPNIRKDTDLASRLTEYCEQAKQSALPLTDAALIVSAGVSRVTFYKWVGKELDDTPLRMMIRAAQKEQDQFLNRSSNARTRAGQRVIIAALRKRVSELEMNLRSCLVREAAIIDALRREHGFDAAALHRLQSGGVTEERHVKPRGRARADAKESRKRRFFARPSDAD